MTWFMPAISCERDGVPWKIRHAGDGEVLAEERSKAHGTVFDEMVPKHGLFLFGLQLLQIDLGLIDDPK